MVHERIEQSVFLRASVDRVWAALTEPQSLRRWFGGDTAPLVDLRAGGSIVFDHPGHGSIPAELVDVTEPTFLSFRWAVIGPPGEQADATNSTVVEFALGPVDGGTEMSFVERGFNSVKTTPEELEARYTANSQGWPRMFAALQKLVEGNSPE